MLLMVLRERLLMRWDGELQHYCIVVATALRGRPRTAVAGSLLLLAAAAAGMRTILQAETRIGAHERADASLFWVRPRVEVEFGSAGVTLATQTKVGGGVKTP
ncbi:unnamed protein product [Lampetra planeri]